MAADPEGVVIISRAEPQSDQVNEAPEGPLCNAPASIPKPLVTFYKGEPEVLGTVQILVGTFFSSFGIMFSILCKKPCRYMDFITYIHLFIWTGGLYIISGSVSLVASVKPTIVKVRASLVMNMISIAAASMQILMTSTIFPSPLFIPLHLENNVFCAYYKPNTECIGAFDSMVCLRGIIVFLFLFTVLIFCITISTSIFACRTVCRSSYNETRVIIYQSPPLNAPTPNTNTTEVPSPSDSVLDT